MADTSLVFNILANDKTGGGLSSAKKRAIAAFAVIGAAAAAFAVESVKSASRAEQSMGATSTVFGKYADQVVAKSDQAAQAYGLSANEYRENANLIGALFKNQGVAQDQLAAATDGMIGKASDLAATFGGTTREAVEALGSAFKGEFDPLERYGISLKQSSINAYLAQKGQDKLTGAALAAAKQQATLALVQQQSADSTGAFGRESDTLAHQQQVLAAQFENVKAKVGAGLLPILTTAGQFVNDTLVPAFQSVADWMGKNSNATKVLIGVLGTGLGVLYAVSAATKVMVAAQAIWKAATIVTTGVQWALNAALTANPIGIVVVAIAALVGALVLLYQKNETVRKIVDAVWSGIKIAIGAVVSWFKDTAWPKIKGVAELMGGIWDTIASGAKAAFNGIASAWNNTVGSLTFGVPDWVPGLGGKGWDVPDIPMLANGGIVTRPTLALVGEAGPEAVVPLSRRGGGYGGPQITINVQSLDPRESGRQVVKALDEVHRTYGIKPNYAA